MAGLRRFVADLLAGRRPRSFRAAEADEPELRAAIMLRAAGEEAPSVDFMNNLHDRLTQEMAGKPSGSRRRFVQTASVAAAAAAVGVGGTELLSHSGSQPAGQTQAEPTLQPDVGQWRAVVASAELPDGGVRPFDLGSLNGFVERTNGRLRAVSGVCTHLGCRLTLDAPERQLNCPCHTASFALTGEVLHHELPISLRPLPLLPVREIDGAIEVFAPPA